MLRRTTVALVIMLLGVVALAQSPKTDSRNAASRPAKSQKEVPQEFNEQVANDLLETFRQGLIANNLQKALSVFDSDRFSDYPAFVNQMQTLFASYDRFEVHFQILETSIQGTSGRVLVDFQLEKVPVNTDRLPIRKEQQIRFEMQRTNSSWKITEMEPLSFFS